MKKFLPLLLVLGFFAQSTISAKTPAYVSLIRLIADPAEFNGKLVSVVGFLRLEPEGAALYVAATDYDNGLSENALHLELSDQIAQSARELNMSYVRLVGTFSTKHLGDLPFPSGEIIGITRCELWSRPNHPRAERYKELWKKPAHQ